MSPEGHMVFTASNKSHNIPEREFATYISRKPAATPAVLVGDFRGFPQSLKPSAHTAYHKATANFTSFPTAY
jgi:hypothetical protein